MVALLGAHSIGHAECPFFSSRLYSFNDSHPTGLTLDPTYASFLKRKCPINSDGVTPNRLDNQYYRNLKNKMGVLAADQVLASSPLTANIVRKYTNFPHVWAADFAAAMVHLGSIIVRTGTEGEIRKKCEVVN